MSETSDLSEAINDSINKANSSSLKVRNIKYDPVTNPIIRENDNRFVGYFGFPRIRTNYTLKKHTGFDYVAEEGTQVIAVQSGEIDRIRFGRPPGPVYEYYEYDEKTKIGNKKNRFTCPFLKLLIDGTNCFDKSTCKNCSDKYFVANSNSTKKIKIIINGKEDKKEISVSSISEECFGIQVWLKTKKSIDYNLGAENSNPLSLPLYTKTYDTGYYAYYAHLRSVNTSIFNEVRSKYFSDIEEYSKHVLFLETRSKTNSDFKPTINSLSMINTKSNSVIIDGILKPKIFEQKVDWYRETTIVLSSPIKVRAGDIIGESGCTGNAYDMEKCDKNNRNQQHLHFECRKGIETKTQISPNHIVKTPFYIAKNVNPIEIINLIGTSKTNEELLFLVKKKENDWELEIQRTDKASIKRNAFQKKCYAEEWNSYKGKMTEQRFKDEIWLGESGIKKTKWKNFEFVDKTSLSELEAKKWEAFLSEYRKKFDVNWWNDFQTNYKIVAGTNTDANNSSIISFQ